MTLVFNTRTGTGRAICKLCEKKIKKGKACIIVYGYFTEAQCHLSPDDCEVIKNRLRVTNWKARIE